MGPWSPEMFKAAILKASVTGLFFKILQFLCIGDLTQNSRHFASLQVWHYIQMPVHVNGMLPREARLDGVAVLGCALGLILLVTQPLQWDACRQKVFLAWRGL